MEKLTLLTNESPFTLVGPTIQTPKIGGSDDWYGACSIEDFLPAGSGGSDLYATHEDAEGFLDYPTQFRNANFWYKDGSVKSWMYGEQYDNYLDTYGADAVTVFYHSGHGGMDNNGVFYLPMGGVWDGSSGVNSTQMFLGNEEARYVFFSTCLSCRVLEGHSPIKTWWGHCLGVRMLFGFETVSLDRPEYGKWFWEEWKKGKSFSQSWLDSSWRIYHGQAPSVVAMGANQAEAVNRLNNERVFTRDAAVTNWMQWKWYYADRSSRALSSLQHIPDQGTKLEFSPVESRAAEAQRVAKTLGFTKKGFDQASIDQTGNIIVNSGNLRAIVSPDGRRDYQIKSINAENRQSIDPDKARSVAERMVTALDLPNQQLVFDTYRVGRTCGGTNEGSGKLDEPNTTDVTVVFRPVVNGIPNVNTDHGNLSITVDNDGSVTSIRDTTRVVEAVRDVPVFADPKTSQATKDIAQVLTDSVKGRYGRAKTSLLLDTVQVGYDYSGKTGGLVAQGTFEINFGQDIRKLYQARVPIA